MFKWWSGGLARWLLPGFMLAGLAQGINWQAPVLPDPSKTPGDVLTSDPAVICKPGYTKTVRNVPQQLKEQMYRSYGILSREKGEYEIDHLISLELGGSNSVRNLWPESYQTQPLNAHVKDAIENKLHELACGGKISFPEAQQAIAHNWEAAYVQYIGPLPGGSVPAKHPNQPSIPVTHVPTLPKGAAVPENQQPTLSLPILPGYPEPTPDSPDSMPDLSEPPPADSAAPTSTNQSSAVQPDADGRCPAEAPIKVSQSGVYHLPQGDGNYERTRAVACFASADAAVATGYRPVK